MKRNDLYVEVVYRLYPHAFKYAYGNKQDTEDLLQDTVLKLLKAKPKMTGVHLERYARLALRSVFIDKTRTEKKHRKNVVVTWDGESLIDVVKDKFKEPDNTDSNIIMEDILESVERLPTILRDTIMLRISGYSYREISEETGIKIGTIKARIFRCRELLYEENRDRRFKTV